MTRAYGSLSHAASATANSNGSRVPEGSCQSGSSCRSRPRPRRTDSRNIQPPVVHINTCILDTRWAETVRVRVTQTDLPPYTDMLCKWTGLKTFVQRHGCHIQSIDQGRTRDRFAFIPHWHKAIKQFLHVTWHRTQQFIFLQKAQRQTSAMSSVGNYIGYKQTVVHRWNREVHVWLNNINLMHNWRSGK